MTTDRPGFRAATALLLGAVVALGAAGCQREVIASSDGRPMPPKPTQAPEAPPGIQPDRLLLVVSQSANDSDGNGYEDQFSVTAGLFARAHPTAFAAEGTFVFTLWKQGEVHRAGATAIAEWRFDSAAIPAIVKPWGAGYDFRVSLLDAGSDRLPRTACDLRGRFEPADGAVPVRASDEVRPVVVGRR